MLVRSFCMCRAKECEVTQSHWILGGLASCSHWHARAFAKRKLASTVFLTVSWTGLSDRETVTYVFPIDRLSLLVTVGLYARVILHPRAVPIGQLYISCAERHRDGVLLYFSQAMSSASVLGR